MSKNLELLEKFFTDFFFYLLNFNLLLDKLDLFQFFKSFNNYFIAQ